MNFKHKYIFLFPGLFVLIGILIFPIITFALLVIGLLRAPMEKDSLWADIRD